MSRKIIDQNVEGPNGGLALPSFAKANLVHDQARPFVVVAVNADGAISQVIGRFPTRKSASSLLVSA